jgi:PBSX family phage terminase large subunit
MIRFDKKWYNPLYFILNDLLKDDTISTIFIYGGKSSAKTQSICQLLMKEMVVKGHSSLAFRKESSTIPTTLKESFNLARTTTRLYPAVECQERRYLSTNSTDENRPFIAMKGLDEEEKAKGVEGVQYVLLDELNHFTKGEYETFEMSLRGKKGQKIFGTWNPVSEQSWIKVDIIDQIEWVDMECTLPCKDSFIKKSKDGMTVLIKTTYPDNYWINGSPCGTYGFKDERIIARYEEMRNRNYNRFKVEVLGEWGKVDFGGEILKKWKSERDVIDAHYNKDLAVYLSFDENVNPYFPCGIFQVEENQKSVRMIACITAKNPNNTVRGICNEIKHLLKQWNHDGKVYITGDATSQKEDVKQEKGHNLFRILQQELKEYSPIIKIGASNPSVVTSTDFFNSILDYNAQDINFKVDKKCRMAISDFENTKEDKNGKVDKKTIIDPITKVSYQPYGHIFDLTRYFLVNVFNSEYIRFQGNNIVANVYSGKDNKSDRY